MAVSQSFPDVGRSAKRAASSPAPKAPPAPPPIKALPIPDDAVAVAADDILTVPKEDRTYQRYIFNQRFADKRNMRLASLITNYVSRGTSIYRPVVLADGMLLRVDLRFLAPKRAERDEYLKLWEEFAFDPSFSRLITKDVLDNVAKEFPATRTVTKRFTRRELVTSSDGTSEYKLVTRTRTFEEVIPEAERTLPDTTLPTVRGKKVQVVRLDSLAIDPVNFGRLQAETFSQAPVVELKYFVSRAVTTIKDAGVYKEIFGGLYYDLRGIKKAADVLGKDTKATDLDLFFENLGIGNIKGGLTQEQLFNNLRSDQRAVMYRRTLTGKPADMVSFNTPNARWGTGWGAITGDIRRQDIDVGDRPFANLLNPRRQAREAIFPDPKGLLMFALFNGAGARQDAVPSNITSDDTIPDGLEKDLQIIGCITCHSMKGKDGWQPWPNDVKDAIKKRFDVFGERRRGRVVFDEDTTDRLRGAFTGDFSLNLSRARDDLARATLECTGPWEGSEDQSDVCNLAAKHLHDTHYQGWLAATHGIDALAALAELGIDVPKTLDKGGKDITRERALAVYNEIVDPDPRARLGDITLEDPRHIGVASGKGLTRSDWSLFRDFAAERVSRSAVWRKHRGAR